MAARLIADLRNIAFSLGSACAGRDRGAPATSCARSGFQREARRAPRSVFGFGRYTGEEQLASACRHIADEARKEQQELPA